MSVAFDNKVTVTGLNVTTLTTPAFTITSAANVFGVTSLGVQNAVTGVTASLGGVNGVAIIGCLSPAQTFSVPAPPSGSQTATASWTGGAGHCVLGAATVSGAFYATGTTASVTTTLSSIKIQSTNGDLTMDFPVYGNGVFSAPTQTQEWNVLSGTAADGASAASSIGPGTGTTTHAWTIVDSGGGGFVDGVNFAQAISANPSVAVIGITP